MTGDEGARLRAFERKTLELLRERLPALNNFPRSRITFESVRLEGQYPETRVVVSVREYETAHDDVYELWDHDFRFGSPEEAADLITAWVGENN